MRALGASLTLFLLAVYLLTMTSQPIVSDETEYIDAADSLLHFGQPVRDLTAWEFFPTRLPSDDPLPLRQSTVEPLYVWLSVPWVALAETTDGLGVAQTLMSVNALVTALVCAALSGWAYDLTRSRFAAVMTALTLGLLTGFWPYAHTFFREPWAALFSVLGGWALWRGGKWWPLGVIGLVAAFAVKEAVIFGALGLVWLMLPRRVWAWAGTRRLGLALLSGTVGLALLLIYTPVLETVRAAVPSGVIFGFPVLPETTRVALHSYLLAAAGAFWATAPILLLGVPASIVLWRRAEQRVVLAGWLTLLGTALGYALLRGEGDIGGNWFGGTMWPHRFLLPALPFIALLTAPIWDILGKRGNPVLAISTALLGIYSLLWAVMGAVFPWDMYGYWTFEQSGGLSYWSPGLNDLTLSRLAVYLAQVGQFPANLAWLRAGQDGFLWGLLGVAVLAAALMGLVVRGWHWAGLGIAVGFVGVMALWWGGLHALYASDPYYQGERDDLPRLAHLVRQRVPEGEPVLVNQPDTARFWANAGKLGGRPLVVLPYSSVEVSSPDAPRPSPEQLDDPAGLLPEGVAPWLAHVGARQPRLWLVMDRSLDTPWSVRPVERYMADHHYLVREDKLSSFARLLEYDTTPIPSQPPQDPPVPLSAIFTDPTSGEQLVLLGSNVPVYSPHTDSVVVSLAWQVEAGVTQDVTVATFVVNLDGLPNRAQGMDSWLGGTFRTSSLLVPGQPIWEHRGVRVDDLPAGRYVVVVRVYTVDASGTLVNWLSDAGADGAVTLPPEIAVP